MEKVTVGFAANNGRSRSLWQVSELGKAAATVSIARWAVRLSEKQS